MKTVLILAYECAPYHRPGSVIGAQRPYQFAKHLPKFGWRAIVLCCDFSGRYFLDPREHWELIVKKEVSEKLSNGKSHQSLTIPLPSLRFADIFDKIWLSSVFFDKIKGTFSAKPNFWNGLKRKITSFIKLFRGDHSQSWQKVAFYASEVILELGEKIDIIIAEHGPDAGVFIAHQLNSKKGIPWIIDFRDPLLVGKNKFVHFILKLYFKQLFNSCEGLINVTPYWSELDSVLFPKLSCYCIPNGYDEEEFQKLKKTTFSKGISLYYFGSIKSGQSFKILFQALQFINNSFPEKFDHFEFNYNGPSKDIVLAEKKEFCPSLSGSIGDSIDRRLTFEIASQCDILILLSRQEDNIYFRKGFYPGKVFEYFGFKKLIIVLPSDKKLLDALIKETSAGETFDNPYSLANYLEKCLEMKKKGIPLFDPNDLSVGKYTRKYQSKQLAEVLSRALGQEMKLDQVEP